MDGDLVLVTLRAKTRFQTGLAAIETIRLENGKEVSINIPELQLKAIISVNFDEPFVTATLTGGNLRLARRATTPGYV